MEKELLLSFITYPNNLQSFLSKVPFKAFSVQAQKILSKIVELNSQNTLSLQALHQTLSEEITKSEFYLDMCVCTPNPNYINQAEIFLNAYMLRMQEELAQKVLRATKQKQIIDIELLYKEMQSVSTKELTNFDQWQQEYATKPQMPKLKTGISFLDSTFEGGFELAQLILISGDPEAGKTMLGLQILEYISRKHKVMFFCFEFTISNFVKRKEKDNKFNKQNFYITNTNDNLDDLIEYIKQAYKQGIRVFLIDSQMRVLSDGSLNMEERESLKFSRLAKLCHSLEIVVFFIIQTAKADADNPMGSKKGGHEASITIRIERCAPDKNDLLQKGNEYDQNKRIISIKKNKQTGKHFKEKVIFDTQALQFKDLANDIKAEYEIDIAQI